MKTSKVLQRVLLHLGDKGFLPVHQKFICSALDFLYYPIGVIGDRDRTRVKKLIRGHLDGEVSLNVWLLNKHGIKPAYTHQYTRKIMATRKAWLAHLIEHYQSKGD